MGRIVHNLDEVEKRTSGHCLQEFGQVILSDDDSDEDPDFEPRCKGSKNSKRVMGETNQASKTKTMFTCNAPSASHLEQRLKKKKKRKPCSQTEHATLRWGGSEAYFNLGGKVSFGGNTVEKLRRDAMQLRKENVLLEESNLRLEQEKEVLARRLREATAGSPSEQKCEIEPRQIKVGGEYFIVIDEYKERCLET